MIARFLFLMFLLLSCNSNRHDNSEYIDRYLDEINYDLHSNAHIAEGKLTYLIHILDTANLRKYEGEINCLKGYLYLRKGQIDSALNTLENVNFQLAVNENNRWLARSNFVLGKLTEEIGFSTQAKMFYIQAIDRLDGDTCRDLFIAHLGLAKSKISLNENGLDNWTNGIEGLKSKNTARLNLMAELYNTLEEDDKKLKIKQLEELLASSEQLNTKTYSKLICNELGGLYSQLNEPDTALAYINKGLLIKNKDYSDQYLLPNLLYNKAMIKLNVSEKDSAHIFFISAINRYRKYNNYRKLYDAYMGMHTFNKNRSNMVDAIIYYNMADMVQDFVHTEDKRYLVQLTKILNGYKLKKAEIENIKIDRAFKRNLLLLCSGILIICLIGMILLIRHKQRNKERILLQRNIEFQRLLIGIGEKKHIAEGVIENDLINENNSVDSKDLHVYFDKCYEQSMIQISQKYPFLSKTEVRYAVMFALTISQDIIAEILQVNTSSIRKVKQRIRLKLGLKPDVKLEQFFQLAIREEKITNPV